MTSVFVYEDVCATGAGGDDGSPPAPSLLAEGRAMLSAVADDFRAVPGVRVTTCGTATDFPSLAAAADYTLVIAPECGGRLEYLCREVFRVGGRLLGPSPDAVHLAADKLALARHWIRCDVPTPATCRLGDAPAGLPLVVKPRDGAGSQQIRRAERREPPDPDVGRLSRAVGRDGSGEPSYVTIGPLTGHPLAFNAPTIAQEYVPGFAASVAFLIGQDTIMPLVPCEQRLSTDGRFQYRGGSLPIAADLPARAVRIATAAVRCVPGLRGYVGVDVVLGTDGRDWAIEINPRLTTSYVGLRVLARFNLAAAMLAAVRGESMPVLAWHDGNVEFTPDGAVTRTPTPTARANT
jgi:tyramine---L-glutamate ligase